jgi:ubiquinone/menaquinone biosynthesis C-methylase UbiE
MQPDQKAISVWRDSAPFWEKHREIIRQMFAPVTQALVEDGLISSRHAVLDIATGPGEPALTIAALVGPEGKVFGIDPASEMVEAARRAANHLEFRNAQFDVASADRMPFPADTFDAVVSRFGVMFFPSPVDAVREMLRVLKQDRNWPWRSGISPKQIPFSTRCRESSTGMSIRHRSRPMLRTHSVLPAQASYGTFLPRPARWLHPSACCNSRCKRRFQSKTFG